MKISKFNVRGSLGGLAGGPLFLIGNAVHDRLRMGHVPYGGALQFMALPYLLLIGIILGSIIGCIIWAFLMKAQMNLSAARCSIIGASFVFFLIILLKLFGKETAGVIAPSWIEQLVNGAMFVACLGALPGLLASARRI